MLFAASFTRSFNLPAAHKPTAPAPTQRREQGLEGADNRGSAAECAAPAQLVVRWSFEVVPSTVPSLGLVC